MKASGGGSIPSIVIMDLNKIFEERMQRIMLIVEISTKKIVKRELKKLKIDIFKELKGF